MAGGDSISKQINEEQPPFIMVDDLEDGTEITYLERVVLPTGQDLIIPVSDYITTMQHPLNGREVKAPATIVAKLFARWDHVIGHENMADHVTRAMATEYGDDWSEDEDGESA
mgnify:FL=1